MGFYQKALQCRQNVVRYGLTTVKCTGQKKGPMPERIAFCLSDHLTLCGAVSGKLSRA